MTNVIEFNSLSTAKPTAPAPYAFPPGLVGELAEALNSSAVKQIREVALVAALGFVAGVAGRAFLVRGVGLNIYIALLAESGVGKAGVGNGINKLFNSCAHYPASNDFRGPLFASGQGLAKYLPEHPSIVTIVEEVGDLASRMTNLNANSSDKMLKTLLKAVFTACCRDGRSEAIAYSQKGDYVPSITAPALTLACEGTPGEFWKAVREDNIKEGFMQRFMIIMYNGGHVFTNRERKDIPNELVEKLGNLIATAASLQMKESVTPVDIKFTKEASDRLDKFDDDIVRYLQSLPKDSIDVIWSRAAAKVMKIAGLIAVGCTDFSGITFALGHPNGKVGEPVITLEILEGAIDFVNRETSGVIAEFKDGNVGNGNVEQKRIKLVCKTMVRYMNKSDNELTKADYEQRKKGLIDYGYIANACAKTATFTENVKDGAAKALKETLIILVDSGAIEKVEKTGLKKQSITYNILDRNYIEQRATD